MKKLEQKPADERSEVSGGLVISTNLPINLLPWCVEWLTVLLVSWSCLNCVSAVSSSNERSRKCEACTLHLMPCSVVTFDLLMLFGFALWCCFSSHCYLDLISRSCDRHMCCSSFRKPHMKVLKLSSWRGTTLGGLSVVQCGHVLDRSQVFYTVTIRRKPEVRQCLF